jgi:mutual gliding-motility protein MglA
MALMEGRVARMSILYTGAGGSGKATSLGVLDRSCSPPLNPSTASGIQELESGAARDVYVDDVRYEVTVGVTSALCTYYFANPEEMLRSPQAAREVDYLKQVDGLVVVVDSQPSRVDASDELLGLLDGALRKLGRRPKEIPVVFQMNKRDLPGAISVDEVRSRLRWPAQAHVESVAVQGVGVTEAFVRLMALLTSSARSGG